MKMFLKVASYAATAAAGFVLGAWAHAEYCKDHPEAYKSSVAE